MCTAQSEIDQRFAVGGKDHPGSLRGDDRLEMHEIDKAGFGKLGLRQRRNDAKDRLVREEYGVPPSVFGTPD